MICKIFCHFYCFAWEIDSIYLVVVVLNTSPFDSQLFPLLLLFHSELRVKLPENFQSPQVLILKYWWEIL